MADTLRIAFLMIKNNETTPIWNKQVSNKELLAGMLAIGIPVTENFNRNIENKIYIVTSTTDVSQYRVLQYIPEEELNRRACGHIMDNEMGVWCASDIIGHYHLYSFSSEVFLQGMLSLCATFETDIRDYIYGLPFDNKGVLYYIPTYIGPTNNIAFDTPDLNDREEEEADDENILEPLKKDW
jgi:hypothetical protein